MNEYDFGLTWDKNKCLFTDSLVYDCKEKGLSFLWVPEDKVRDVTKKLETGKIRIKVLLDTEATYDVPGEPYARLCYAVKDAGGVVINDPDRTRISVDKSVVHYELAHSGISTPYTVVVRNWEPRSFRLSDNEKSRLGKPFIIKPACGWGHRGVIYNAIGSIKEIAKARNFDPYDNFLLQEKIHPIELNSKRAWFRIFHVFNEIIPCWWDDRTSRYEHITAEEFRKYKLTPLVKTITKIASITKMSWFSTEIAIDKKQGRPRFITIDYVNDQCDMEAKSESKDGVPDHIVKFTAYSIIHAAKRLARGKTEKPNKEYTILLRKGGKFKMRGLGYAPELLHWSKSL
ncbi:hypothetical protein ACFL5E_00805 [Candidatus Omnitrophota bacterium]